MTDFQISEDIYRESLCRFEESHKITDAIFAEAAAINQKSAAEILKEDFHASGRYWIWKFDLMTYKREWKSQCEKNEMQIQIKGLRYLDLYLSLSEMETDYEFLHPNREGEKSLLPACWAFCKDLQKGDIVLACNNTSSIIGWCIIDGPYKYKPSRANGRHYRSATWFKINMPFIFTNQTSDLFQIPLKETNNLAEALLHNVKPVTDLLPFVFTRK